MTRKGNAELSWAAGLISQGNLLVRRAEAGQRRVKPTATDKRQPLQSVLWKVVLNGVGSTEVSAFQKAPGIK